MMNPDAGNRRQSPRVPAVMRAIVLDRYCEDLTEAIEGLRVAERPVPAPGRGQVLVKIEAAPCNPSDLVFLQAKYGSLKTLPSVPGWEGAGRVVASGGGWLARWLEGRRVACALEGDRDGTWAEYFLADASDCIPLDPKLPIDQAASLIINPLTAVGLLETARRGGHRAAVHTAGASQVGRMILAMANEAGYPVIHVVRREAQVDLLRALGAEHVLDCSRDDFSERLRGACQRLGATIAFEAVAGSMTGTVINAMPPGSTALVYGALSEEPCSQIDPVGLLFREKTVTGFYLAAWLRKQSRLSIFLKARRVQQMLIAGRIATGIQRKATLDEAVDALEQYVRHMTDGKVLINP